MSAVMAAAAIDHCPAPAPAPAGTCQEHGLQEAGGDEDEADAFRTITRSAQLANAQSGKRLQEGQRIPWYIVDPTGKAIKDQRREDASKRKLSSTLSGIDRARTGALFERILLAWQPSIFPAWDAVTGAATLLERTRNEQLRHQMLLHQMLLGTRCSCTRCPCTRCHCTRCPCTTDAPAPDAPAHHSSHYHRLAHSHIYTTRAVYTSRVYLSRSPSRTGIALVFTALCTPYEVGFLPAAEAGFPNGGRNLFIINRLIDIVFIIDMFLQFFT